MNHDTGEFHRINGQLLPATEVYALLDALSTNELEPDETASLHQHLAQCEACRQVFAEIGQYHRLLAGVFSNDAPASLRSRDAQHNHAHPLPRPGELALTPSEPRRRPAVLRRASTRLLIAAVVLALIGANILLFHNFLLAQPANSAHRTPTVAGAMTPAGTATHVPNGSWQHLWTLPALPPPPAGTYGTDLPYIPQIAWSPANAQRLYLCRASTSYTNMPAVLHNLYRSDDSGRSWTAYALPEAAANCHLEVDPTDANALVLQDDKQHSYISRDGGQHWQPVPDPPNWQIALGVPEMQIMAGRLYVGGYWTADLAHWTRWYPVAGEQSQVYLQVNPQRPQTLYTAVSPGEFRCTGTPSALQQLAFQSTLCRSDDGGQHWQFLAVVTVAQGSNLPVFCLALNHPATLYAWGYTAQSGATANPGGAIASTDGGKTWSRLPAVLDAENSGYDLPCSADAYAGQNAVRVDSDDAASESNQWLNFGLTADGAFYHVVDTAATRQGVHMAAGVSLLTSTGWQEVIAPYPPGLTTPATNYQLRVLLISPPAGLPVLLAFTDQNVYSYTGFGD